MKSLRILVPLLLLLLAVAITIPATEQRVQAQTYGNGWVGQFWNNPDLTGDPVIGNIFDQINLNFQTGSPFPTFIPANNFSARFNGLQQFNATGTYRFTLQADDGARLYIDLNQNATFEPGELVIDQFSSGDGPIVATYDVFLNSGAYEVQVEYVDRAGIALVQLFWDAFDVIPTETPGPSPTPTATPLPLIPPGALTATVIQASVLNVRDAPSTGGDVITRILRGQTYQVLGRNAGADWFLLQLSGFRGWAYGYYLFVNGNEFQVPVLSVNTGYPPVPPEFTDYGVLVQSKAVMKLRGEPNVLSPQTGRITWGAFLPVTGRSADGNWYQVLWKDTLGWVFTGYLDLIQGDINDVPVLR
jgi:uncharacterized protein YraI